MSPSLKLLPLVAGLLLALTYLALRAATPDSERHERMLDALRTLTLNEAALHRDILRTRDGLLRNYDPLVRSTDELRDAGLTLQALHDTPELDEPVRRLRSALDEQQNLVETFKSSNALLQNSLSYFIHAIGAQDPGDPAAAAAATIAGDMLQFIGNPGPESAASVTASLDRLVRSNPRGRQDLSAFAAHGRLIVATMPLVDGIVARLLASPVGARTRAVQDLYLEHHGQATTRANRYRLLLYAAAVILAAHLAYLFQRLRRNAQDLRARLRFENLIAEISTQFINLPRERMADGIRHGLTRLAEYAAVDRAYLLQCGPDGQTVDRVHAWAADGVPDPASALDRLAVVASRWGLGAYRRQRCIYVPSVKSMPASAERTDLSERGIGSWLCVPLRRAGKLLGLLGFETVGREQRRTDDDIALFRTAGEIFANALERGRTEAENEALQARLRRAQRLEAIGTLAGGIAHNFNNVLGAILGYSEMALGRLAADSRPWRYVTEVRQAGLRAKAVVDQMLAFSRRTEHVRRRVLMREVVEEAIGMLRASLPATIVIRVNAHCEDAAVHGDPMQLQQVLMNLCTNAAHALGGQGTIEIGFETVEFEQEQPLSHGSLAAGRYVRVTVSDTGHGMDPETLERIFEPFFTTKPAGLGTGLGLATVHGIVADHGGAMNVHSRPGGGSRFEAYVAAAAAGTQDSESADLPVPLGHGEAILLVEDDRSLMLLGEEMAAALGYEPIGFDSSTLALAAFRADPDRFDLLLTDQVMPELTGMELAAAVRRLRPEIPVILVTGHEMPIGSEQLQAAGVREVLKKPLLSADLARALARQLAAGRDGE